MPEFLKVMDDWGGYAPVGAHKISEAAQSRFLDLLSNRERRPQYQQEYLLRDGHPAQLQRR